MGLFKIVKRVADVARTVTGAKYIAPVLAATSTGMLGTATSILNPKALSVVGIKSAESHMIARAAGIGMAGALAVGGGISLASMMTSYVPTAAEKAAWLGAATKPVMGESNGAAVNGATVGGASGFPVRRPRGRQGRRPIRSRRGRCWSSHGRRYCYR